MTSWTQLFPKSNWAEHLASHSFPLSFVSEEQKNDFVEEQFEVISSLIDQGKIGKALDYLTIVVLLNKSVTIHYLKKEGLLRYSSYVGSKSPVAGIADHFLRFKSLFCLNQSEILYFESLVNFEPAGISLSRLNKGINEELFKFKNPSYLSIGDKRQKRSKLKSLLAVAESYFLIEDYSYDKTTAEPTALNFYSREEIAEGISFLVSRYNDLVGINKSDLILIDEQYIESDAIRKLIVDACMIKAIKEFEMFIEHFGYHCIQKNNNIIIQHSDITFEKALDLSNIIFDAQNNSSTIKTLAYHKGARSMMELADLVTKNQKDCFELQTYPFKRYVLKIPADAFTIILDDATERFFLEEIPILEELENDLFIPFDSLSDYEIIEGLSFRDLFKFHRMLKIKSMLFRKKFQEELNGKNRLIALGSIVSVFNREDFFELLRESLQVTNDKIEKFLSVMCWKTSDKKAFVDLQYQPIIETEEHYFVLNSVLTLSNVNRNVFLSENKKANNIKQRQIKKHISLEDMLEFSFLYQGFQCWKEIKFKHKTDHKNQGDIDFLAFKEGYLFVAECKDSFHPNDAYELRTTYNYVQKAHSQLTYILEALADKVFLENLCNRLGISELDITHIQPCVVLSNKKFWGYTYHSVPIRHVHELNAFLTRGKWYYKDSEEDDVLCYNLWRKDYFEPSDLINFCSSSSPHTIMFDTLIESYMPYGNKLFQRMYGLNMSEAYKKIKERFPYTTVPSDEYFNKTSEGNVEITD